MDKSAITDKRIQVADTRPHPRNYNRHDEAQVEDLRESLRQFGQVRSVVVQASNRNGAYLTVAGHGLIEAARLEGLTHLRANVIPASWSSAKVLAYLAADNELARRGTPDEAQLARLVAEVQEREGDVLARLAAGEKKALDRLLRLARNGDGGVDAEPQIDRAAELQRKWGTARGQLWELPTRSGNGAHRLLCGDSTVREDVKRVMDILLMLMVTDPPYGVEYDPAWRNEAAEKGLISFAASREGIVENDERVDWSESWGLFNGSIVYCWHAGRHASVVQDSLECTGFEIRSQIIWSKQTFAISRGNYHWQHEPCWYAVRKGAKADWIGDRSQTTLWSIQWDKNVEGGHGTQKPLECMARPIRNHEGDVYDPFLGSGTTLVACENLGRLCRAIEIAPEYVAVALQRYQDAFGIEPQLIESGNGKAKAKREARGNASDQA